MKRALLPLVLCALSGLALADAQHGAHCTLTEPPAGAVVATLAGEAVRVFPAASAITPAFSGCQVVWKLEAGRPVLETKIVFKAGKPLLQLGAEGAIELPDCADAQVAKAEAEVCGYVRAFPLK